MKSSVRCTASVFCLACVLPAFARAGEFASQPPGSKVKQPASRFVDLTPKTNVPKPKPDVPPFRDGQFGHLPHLGQPDDGGQGYPHYDYPNYRYDLWYRPHAFGWGKAERCAPDPFRPRGLGNVFNEPSTCYRLDYNRYVIKNYRSEYGPSYYHRLPDERCDDYDFCKHHRKVHCDCSRVRRTQVWTLSDHQHLLNDN